MAEDAKREMEQEESGTSGKKRKGGAGSRVSKKQKKNDASAAALKSAQEKHKANVGGNKPIFIQPPLLANGCVLKDYQLEGVRWLTSLFENGVSGILADEMVRLFQRWYVRCYYFIFLI